MKEPFWNLPNAISLYRLLAVPLICVLLVTGSVRWYVGFLTVSLLSDILDGWAARAFKMRTEVGARLDSLADVLIFLLAICGVARFQWAAIAHPPRPAALLIFLACYGALMITGLLKFGRQPSLHTYGFKIAAYLQGACLLWTFWIGFSDPFYYFVLLWGTAACIEEIVILGVLKEPRSDVKGLYWVLQQVRADQ